MFKTLKWVYELGVRHERMRVKLLIRGYRQQKPDSIDFEDSESYRKALELWTAVDYELGQLTDPQFGEYVEKKALIDED